MDLAKKLKVGLDRVLTGRVTKRPKFPTTHTHADSKQEDSSMAHRGSVPLEDISQALIKQEDDDDSAFASESPKSTIETGLESALGEKHSTGSRRGQTDEESSDEEMTDKNAQNDHDEDWNTTKSVSPNVYNDAPIPSVEADEEGTPSSKPKSVPYLHGAAKIKKHVKSLRVGYFDEEPGAEDDQVPVEDDLGYDELEDALVEESEENLLISEEDLLDYIKHKLAIGDIDTWPREAARLYKLLYLRGLYPLMTSGWVWDFFGHPMPDGIFTPRGSDDKALIKAYNNQVHAAKAIRALFHLYSRVRGLRETGQTGRIGPLIRKEINVYLRWATRDADLRRIGYEIGFVWPVFVLDFSRAHDADRIVRACSKCAQKYQAKWADLAITEYPRLITVFAIIQHMVVVMVVDIDNHETQEPMPMTEIDLSELNHWLDCAITISIPIMLARESLLAYRDSFPVTEKEESDPDL